MDTQIQYNDGGAFGGDAGLTYDEATDQLTIAGDFFPQQDTYVGNDLYVVNDADIGDQLDVGGNIVVVGTVDGVDVSDHDARHAVGGLDTLFPADPGADKYLKWDDAGSVLTWADAGGGGASPMGFNDDVALSFGTGNTSSFLWETADANANALLLALPVSNGTDIPALVIGDTNLVNVDLTLLNTFTFPSFSIIDTDRDSYLTFTYSADDVPMLTSNRSIVFRPSGNTVILDVHSNDAIGAIYQSQKSRGTATVPVIVTTGDILREDRAYGYDGANYLFMGASYFKSIGTIAATRVPTQYEVWIATDTAPSVLAKSLMLSNAVTAFGISALTVNTGASNSAFGSQALYANSTGANNSAFGYNALRTNSTGSKGSAFGSGALYTNLGGLNNSAFGYQALYANANANYNSAFGYMALSGSTGNNNSAFGMEALKFNATGGQNSAFGYQALYANTDRNYNSGFGYMALYNNSTGDSNVALGYKAGYYETGGNKLFIDNAQRTNEADGRIKALIYGVFGAATINQVLTVNAKRVNLPFLPTYANNAAAIAGGLLVGDLYRVNAAIDPEPVYIVH